MNSAVAFICNIPSKFSNSKYNFRDYVKQQMPHMVEQVKYKCELKMCLQVVMMQAHNPTMSGAAPPPPASTATGTQQLPINEQDMEFKRRDK